jgi:hypothetical protein
MEVLVTYGLILCLLLFLLSVYRIEGYEPSKKVVVTISAIVFFYLSVVHVQVYFLKEGNGYLIPLLVLQWLCILSFLDIQSKKIHGVYVLSILPLVAIDVLITRFQRLSTIEWIFLMLVSMILMKADWFIGKADVWTLCILLYLEGCIKGSVIYIGSLVVSCLIGSSYLLLCNKWIAKRELITVFRMPFLPFITLIYGMLIGLKV